MFIQVIQAKVGDEAGLREAMQRWRQDLMPGAKGYLGTTAGVAADGRFVALARFESPEAANENSARPEQGEWWAEMSKNFDGEASFMNCDDVRVWMDGGSDDAGFVQIMQGRSDDVDGLFSMMSSRDAEVRAARPEIIGALMLNPGDGRYLTAVYFTSEDEARRGEQQEQPEDMREEWEERSQAMGEVDYLDLPDPELVSPPA